MNQNMIDWEYNSRILNYTNEDAERIQAIQIIGLCFDSSMIVIWPVYLPRWFQEKLPSMLLCCDGIDRQQIPFFEFPTIRGTETVFVNDWIVCDKDGLRAVGAEHFGQHYEKTNGQTLAVSVVRAVSYNHKTTTEPVL